MHKISFVASVLALMFGGCADGKPDSAKSEAMAASNKMAGKWVDADKDGVEGMNPQMPGMGGGMGPPGNAAQAVAPPAAPLAFTEPRIVTVWPDVSTVPPLPATVAAASMLLLPSITTSCA